MDSELSLLADIAKFKELKVLQTTEGGRMILDALISDIITSINSFSDYKNMTHIEFIALSVRLSERLATYKVFALAESNEKALIKILKEDYKKSEED